MKGCLSRAARCWVMVLVMASVVWCFQAPAWAERAIGRSAVDQCSLWGEQLRCGASQATYSCRAMGSGDVAPSPGAEKLLACRSSGQRGTKALAKFVVLSREGKLLDVVSDRVDTSYSNIIASVKVANIVDDTRREVVIEYQLDPTIKVKAGRRRSAVKRREISILKWVGDRRGGELEEVFRACTMQRPQPVSFARAAKISFLGENTIRVQAKQQEYFGEKIRRWWSDVTYIWNAADNAYVASSCADLADHVEQLLGQEESEGDINKGMRCVAKRPSSSIPIAAAKISPPPPPISRCSAPARTNITIENLNASSLQGGTCPMRAVKAALGRTVRVDISGRGCDEVFIHRESFSIPSDRGCSYELVFRGKLRKNTPNWIFEEEAVELRSHCEAGASCRQELTTAKVASSSSSSSSKLVSQCLVRLEGEAASGRILRECYERIVGLADNDSLSGCDVGELTRSLCGE